MNHEPSPDRFALKFVGALLLFVALAVAFALTMAADAEAGVGNVGRVGQLMSPGGAGPGGEPGPPANAITTEDGAALTTEDDLYILTEG